MNKDQMIACVDDAVKAHVEHLFDAFRLSIIRVTDAGAIAKARGNFSEGLDEIAFARREAVRAINARPDAS